MIANKNYLLLYSQYENLSVNKKWHEPLRQYWSENLVCVNSFILIIRYFLDSSTSSTILKRYSEFPPPPPKFDPVSHCFWEDGNPVFNIVLLGCDLVSRCHRQGDKRRRQPHPLAANSDNLSLIRFCMVSAPRLG